MKVALASGRSHRGLPTDQGAGLRAPTAELQQVQDAGELSRQRRADYSCNSLLDQFMEGKTSGALIARNRAVWLAGPARFGGFRHHRCPAARALPRLTSHPQATATESGCLPPKRATCLWTFQICAKEASSPTGLSHAAESTRPSLQWWSRPWAVPAASPNRRRAESCKPSGHEVGKPRPRRQLNELSYFFSYLAE